MKLDPTMLSAAAIDGLSEVVSLDARGGAVAIVTRTINLTRDRYDTALRVTLVGEGRTLVLGDEGKPFTSVRLAGSGASAIVGRADSIDWLEVDSDIHRRSSSRVIPSCPSVWLPNGRAVVCATRLSGAGHAPARFEQLPIDAEGRGLIVGSTELVVLDSSGSSKTVAGDGITPHAVSPDSSRVACVHTRHDALGRPIHGLLLIDLHSARVTAVPLALDFLSSLAFHPSGSRLAVLGARGVFPPADHAMLELLIVELDGRTRRLQLPDSWDPVVLSPPSIDRGARWLGDQRIALRVARRGLISLLSIDVSTGHAQFHGDQQHQVMDWAALDADTLCSWSVGSTTSAQVQLEGAQREVLWRSGWQNEALLREVRFEGMEVATDEVTLDAWLMRSPGVPDAAPLAVSIHGGPHGFTGPIFSAAHFYRLLLAAQGWRVLTFNPSGSASYGPEFAQRIRGRWGSLDLSELNAVVDACLDGNAAPHFGPALVGFSYGGYLAAWAVTQTHRFSAAVAGAPITNFESFAATSDIGSWYLPAELGDGATAPLVDRTALRHAASCRSPLLLLHGTDDRRVPVGQSRELFHALARATSTPTKLVLYPGATHAFPSSGRPSHRVDYNDAVVSWLTTHGARPSR